MRSICSHKVWSLEIYGHCLMEVEDFDPEIAMDARDTFAVAIARRQPPRTRGCQLGTHP